MSTPGAAKIRLKVTASTAAGAQAGGSGEAPVRPSQQTDEDEDYRPDAEEVVISSDEEEGAGGSGGFAGGDEEEDEWEVYDSEEEEAPRGGSASKAPRKPTRGRGAPGSKAGAPRAAAPGPAKRARPAGGRAKKAGGRGSGAAKAGRRRKRSELGADDDEEWDLEEGFVSDGDSGGTYRLGAADEKEKNYSKEIRLKPDHANRPLWVCPDNRIFLETFSPVYKQATDFLVAVAEPVSRPEIIHEYELTPHSLYAAVSVGLDHATIVGVLGRLSKNGLHPRTLNFINDCTENYGKVKLVLQQNKFFVESPHPDVLRKLLADPTIRGAAVLGGGGGGGGGGGFRVDAARRDRAGAELAQIADVDLAGEGGDDDDGDGDGDGGGGGSARRPAYLEDALEADPDAELHSFEVEASKVERVKERCLPDNLNYPMLEEYDFRNDAQNPDLGIELKPNVQHRPYQEKSLGKMFGNGRARSGIIVLPCGAGKSLVGVSAAARIKKGCLVLCTNGVSVDQWKFQFEMWTSIQKGQVCRFTSQAREWFESPAGVCITTYTMVAFGGRRSAEGERVMERIMSREWGLLLLDEVHVVPAAMFRRVLGIVKAHCKLGLTATLVREDSLIGDLNFLIGPKLYEANWLDLTRGGHIANVQCAEVWCPLTREFAREYHRPGATPTQKNLLQVMNPAKMRACQFLVQYHEQRGDKVIVFSDNIYALREYAVRMRRPFIYGATGHQERTRILHAFKHSPQVNTVFLSKVGDNSLDIPEANVLVQISSHGGSRRQEAQRLGRILRKKRARPGAPGGAEEFDAFFYTLVSRDTQEVYFTAKRQQFLVDQGYSYKVIPALLEAAGAGAPGGDGLLLATRDEQLDVLAAALAAGEAGLEDDEPDDRDDLESLRKRVATKRAEGSMAVLSGGTGLRYMEYSTGGGGRGRGRPAGGGKLAKLAKRYG